jgi:TonB family protein
LNQGGCGGIVEYEPRSLYQIQENEIISNNNSDLKEIYFGEKVGLINQYNEMVLPIEFDDIVQFNNGLINTTTYYKNNYNYSNPPELNIFHRNGKKYIKNQNIVGVNNDQILTSKDYGSKYTIINRENETKLNLNEEIKYIKFFNDFITYYINDALVFQLVNGFQLANNTINFLNEKNTYDEHRYSKEEINEEDFNPENKVKKTNIFYDLDKDNLFSYFSNETDESGEILEFIDEDASFRGGSEALQQWISENIQYPQSAIELGIQGKVYVSFVVEPNGVISNVVVERGVSDDLDREAKRVVRSMPRWKAGKNKGKLVRARCRIPFAFNLR